MQTGVLEPLVRKAGVAGRHFTDLAHDVLRRPVDPICTHGVRQGLDDPPIRPALPQRLYYSANTLYEPFRVRESPFVLRGHRRREDDVRKFGGLAQEAVFHHEEFRLAEGRPRSLFVRKCHDRVVPDHIQKPDCARLRSVDDLE